jgi:hypothetical protein
MGTEAVDWEELAWEKGFKGNVKQMLTKLHYEDRLSLEKMGRVLGLCGSTVGKHMKKMKLEVIKTPSNLPSYTPRLPKGK